MGITPDRIPGGMNPTAKANDWTPVWGTPTLARMNIDTLADASIRWGDTPTVTLVPVTVTNNYIGAMTLQSVQGNRFSGQRLVCRYR